MDEAAVKALQDQVKALSEKFDAQTKELQDAKAQLTESSQFIDDASTLVTAIIKNPELKNQVSAAVQGQPITSTQPTQPTQPAQPDKSNWKFDPETGKPLQAPQEPPKDDRVDSLDGKARIEIIDKIESKYKIPDKDKTEFRKSVGAWLSNYGVDVTKTPVDQLEQKLDDGYFHVVLQTAQKEGKPMDAVETYFTDPGKLPAMGSAGADQNATSLTPEQKKWAGKMNVAEDKVAEGLKELTEKGTITYKPKEEAPKQNQPAPSGQPTPPPTQN